ncbi:MAG: D-alanine--D-alanine ligase [Pseudomonadota bacterium]
MTNAAQTNTEIVAKAGRVGVLMGGLSAEREISLKSGEMVYQALCDSNVDAVKMIWNTDVEEAISESSIDRVFIALHGRGGEDGQVQGLLNLRGLPYTGSGVLGSALAMDKLRSKQIWRDCDVPTPAFKCVTPNDSANAIDVRHFPVMVKPAREGSSIGISKVDEAGSLPDALAQAFQYDNSVIIEQYIDGEEYTLSILDNEALPIIRLETPHEFYDYEAKYFSQSTQYHCPAGLSDASTEQCETLGLRAFNALGASGWGRVDFMWDPQSGPQFIEVNTVPGMTDHSLVPMAAAATDIDYRTLVLKILATSFDGTGR